MTYTTFVDRYRDKAYIGSGGFAKVYKVFDYANRKYVALKVADVRPELKKFTLQNEVELVNQLPLHHNVIRYDACYRFNTGITGEMDFAVLPYYELGNLEQFLNKNKLSKVEKSQLITGILEGVKFLHQSNCIHRDLKAQNILINRDHGVWIPKIADFGLSRYVKKGDLSVSNSSIGLTFEYASPEQIKNQKIYKNVDLWAVGVLIYRIVTGHSPFRIKEGSDPKDAQTQLEISNRIINLQLPPDFYAIEEPYQTIISKCLVIDPRARVQDASELLQILKNQKINHENDKTLVSPNAIKKPEVPLVRNQEYRNSYTPEVSPQKTVYSEKKHQVKYTPPLSVEDQYSAPKANNILKSASIARPTNYQTSKPATMKSPSEPISKFWIYLPLYFLFLVLSVWGLYNYLISDSSQPPTPTKEIVKSPSDAFANFVNCFNQNKNSLGGTFPITPVDKLTISLKSMGEECYDEICNEVKEVNSKTKSKTSFYRQADRGKACYKSLLKASFAYHHSQLEELSLLALFYNSGKSNLSNTQKSELSGFVKSYKRNTDKYGLLLIGRASNVGNSSTNKTLSQKRGNTILKFIKNQDIQNLKSDFVFFGADPPQLNQELANRYGIPKREYKNISFGSGSDRDYALRLNQSVLLVIYPLDQNPFGLE